MVRGRVQHVSCTKDLDPFGALMSSGLTALSLAVVPEAMSLTPVSSLRSSCIEGDARGRRRVFGRGEGKLIYSCRASVLPLGLGRV